MWMYVHLLYSAKEHIHALVKKAEEEAKKGNSTQTASARLIVGR